MANKSRAEECYRQQDYLHSIAYAKQWLFAAKRVGNRVSEKAARKILGWSYYYVGNYNKSFVHGKEELRIAKEEQDKEAQLAAYELIARSLRTGQVAGELMSDIADGDEDAALKELQKSSLGFPNGKPSKESTERRSHERMADTAEDYRKTEKEEENITGGLLNFRSAPDTTTIPLPTKPPSTSSQPPESFLQITTTPTTTTTPLTTKPSTTSSQPPENLLQITTTPPTTMTPLTTKPSTTSSQPPENLLQITTTSHTTTSSPSTTSPPPPPPATKPPNTSSKPKLKGHPAQEADLQFFDSKTSTFTTPPRESRKPKIFDISLAPQTTTASSPPSPPPPPTTTKTKPPNTSSKPPVPNEIKARGPRARLAYENALRNGKVKMYRGRIMLIGQDRAGKTSLKKSLLGLPFDPNEQSTDGIEVDPSKFEFDVEQVRNWQRIDKKPSLSQFANDLVKMVAGELKEDDNINQVPLREENSTPKSSFLQMQKHPLDPHIASRSVNATKEPVITELKIDPSLPPEEFTDLLVQHLKGLDLKSDATSIEHHLTLDLWDFAGQHLYYASYPVFLSPRAVYLLAYNLKKELTDKAQPSVRQGNLETHLTNPTSETNLDNLLSWLVTVSTMCLTHPNDDVSKGNELLYLRPPVFIIGTHADEPHRDIKAMELQIQREVFGKDFEGHVIRPFFSVDNTNGDGIASLQKRIIEVLKQEPYMGEEVPLRWFNFEKVVKGLVATKTYYLELEQLQTIARRVCFIESEDELGTMLDFYHDLGMIIRHRNTVVLRADWLIDVFRQLITIRPFNEMEPIHSRLWKEMEKTGILRMELVDYVFSKFCQQGLIKEDILNMMEQFGLIAKFVASPTDVKYFVPAQLSSKPGRLLQTEPSPSDPCPLYLSFPAGFVPHGLFSQLVSRCTRWCSEIEFKMSPNLFDGAARFRLISKHFIHQFILVCKKRFIKIVLLQSAKEHKAPLADIEEMASRVWRFLTETVKNLLFEFSYLAELQYDWCIACPDCPGKEDCLLRIMEGGQPSNCLNSFSDKTPTVPGLKMWFPIKAVRPGHHPGTEAVYNMTARPRGITLIINNKLFHGHPQHDKQSTRHGSEEDVRQVKALFHALGFEVHTKENLTRLQLLNALDSVACQDHSGYDCFVLWLMSHGKSGEVYCTDGVTLPIQTARDMLCNKQCAALRGKPKLLFVQACRGNSEDEVVTILTNSCSSPDAQQSSYVDSPTDLKQISALKVPEQADFLTAYSTVDDYVSYRLPDLGSAYVRALVQVFQERVASDHLLEILTKVSQRVSGMEHVGKKPQNCEHVIKRYIQVSQIESTLLKFLWF